MKLTKKQSQLLLKRLDEKKALPTMRLDEEKAETNKEEDSPVLKELGSLDKLIDNYIKGFGPSN